MTVDLSVEAIAAIIGATGAFILALIAALTITVRTLSKVVKTILTLNDELQETSRDRQQWHAKEAELTRAVGALTGKITTIQDDCTERETKMSEKLSQFEQRSQEREDVMNNEIEELKTKITSLENEIERLQKELKMEQDLRRRDLRSFDEQICQKNEQIEQLKTERAQLIQRLTKLESAMNGKVDKSDAGALSTIKAPPVTGAMSNQTTKDTQEKT